MGEPIEHIPHPVPMMCGNCGCKTFIIYQENNALITRCTKCESESQLEAEASLTISFKTQDDAGCLCRALGKVKEKRGKKNG